MGHIDRELTITLDDGRTVVAQPRPEDQDFLAQLGNSVALALDPTESDTQGHGTSSEIAIDVEGHAISLRLPTPADAEALRRLLMVGAVSATIVAAGAIASLQGPASNPVQPAAPAAPIAAPAPNLSLAAQREERLGDLDPMWDVTPGSAPSAGQGGNAQSQDTHGPGRGELE